MNRVCSIILKTVPTSISQMVTPTFDILFEFFGSTHYRQSITFPITNGMMLEFYLQYFNFIFINLWINP